MVSKELVETYTYTEVFMKTSILQNILREQREVLPRVIAEHFCPESLIRKHKYLLTDKVRVFIECDLAGYGSWDVFLTTSILAGGRGRPSKSFLQDREERIEKFLPILRNRVKGEVEQWLQKSLSQT